MGSSPDQRTELPVMNKQNGNGVRLCSPIHWFGGKGKMRAKLLPILEAIPHRIYVEPFGGGASLLIAKRPALVEVYNDIDQGLVDFFRLLRDPEQFQRFRRLVELTPYARAEYDDCRATWESCDDPVERARRWFVVARQSFGGMFGKGWGSMIKPRHGSKHKTTAAWQSTVARLPEVVERLLEVQIECADWRVILKRYDTPKTLFYCDPTYLHSTRKAHRYAHELSDQDHDELIAALLGLKGQVVISGYAKPLYARLVTAGWERRDWQTVCHAAGRTRATGIQGKRSALRMQPRTESVWIKPHARDWGLFSDRRMEQTK